MLDLLPVLYMGSRYFGILPLSIDLKSHGTDLFGFGFLKCRGGSAMLNVSCSPSIARGYSDSILVLQV